MLEVWKKVYYCSYCKRHRLLKRAIEQHEKYCTMNPNRECRWSDPVGHRFNGEYSQAAERLILTASNPLSQNDVNWVHDLVNGCPACMLAILRQSGLDYHTNTDYDYNKIVEEWREMEKEEMQDQEHQAIMDSWI